MKHTRRHFIKIGSTALGTLAVPGNALSDVQPPPPASVSQDPHPLDGRVTVSPDEGTAGTYGTWTVTYLVGNDGIHPYGGIRVQLPDSWHSSIRNSAKRLQATNPKAENYVSSSCSRSEVQLRTMVEHEPGPNVVLVKRSTPRT